jgi:hypothetical protein
MEPGATMMMMIMGHECIRGTVWGVTGGGGGKKGCWGKEDESTLHIYI